MIRIIKTYDECRDFAFGFNDDLHFSDPMLCHEEQFQNNLIKSIEKPDKHCVFGIYREEQMIGLFAKDIDQFPLACTSPNYSMYGMREQSV